jgi:peptidoglycan hydrolase-like protein with peptidoglycan-binding domain
MKKRLGTVLAAAVFFATPAIALASFDLDLRMGDRGPEVTAVQQFLIEQGALSADNATGFFGPRTLAAIQAFQTSQGILPASGFFGPLTRAMANAMRNTSVANPPSTDSNAGLSAQLAALFAQLRDLQARIAALGGSVTDGSQRGALAVSPASGVAPLTVSFSGNAIGSYSVSYGDGSLGPAIACDYSACGARSISFSHTYAAGTFIATLTDATGAHSAVITVAGASAAPSISVTASPASVRQGPWQGTGDALNISWSTQNFPANAGVSLWLVDANGSSSGLIRSSTNANGSYAWPVPGPSCGPSPTSPCTTVMDSVAVFATAPGIYAVKAQIYSPSNACLGGLCPQNGTYQVLAASQSAQFTITDASGSSAFTASPASGAAPLAVSFYVPLNLYPQGVGSYLSVDFGDGSTPQIVTCSGNPYPTCSALTGITHTYASPGTYTATLRPYSYCPPNADCMIPGIIGTATITVTGTGGTGGISITGLDAPSSLAVGQTGTWTVHATVPSATQVSYSVAWGDETDGSMQALGAQSLVGAAGTFTHAYSHAGTFYPKFTVGNNTVSAQTSASVVVGKSVPASSCPQYMPPACQAGEVLVGQGYGSDGCPLAPKCVAQACTNVYYPKPTTYCSGSWQPTYSSVGCATGWQCVTSQYTCATDPHVLTMCPNTGVLCPAGKVWCGMGVGYTCVGPESSFYQQCLATGSSPTF